MHPILINDLAVLLGHFDEIFAILTNFVFSTGNPQERQSEYFFWCRRPGSNRYDTLISRDFKSRVSANSTTAAYFARYSQETSDPKNQIKMIVGHQGLEPWTIRL